jgi:TPP-dependent pyruvate/acetoin dehydrogenase alpha subunit
MQARINAAIDEAIQQAEQDPYPEPEDCIRGVYAEE